MLELPSLPKGYNQARAGRIGATYWCPRHYLKVRYPLTPQPPTFLGLTCGPCSKSH